MIKYICVTKENENTTKVIETVKRFVINGDNPIISSFWVNLPLPIDYDKELYLRRSLIDIADELYVLDGWKQDETVKYEIMYAKLIGKKIRYESKQWALRKEYPLLDENMDYVSRETSEEN